MKMTSTMADANGTFKRPKGGFQPDPYLAENGYEYTTHADYYNLRSKPNIWNRGHMLMFDDLRGWGDQAGTDSMLTTNICPQLGKLNQRGWLSLEQRMTEFARDYNRFWLFVGPIYDKNSKPFEPGRRVPSPVAFYRIAIREDKEKGIAAVAFIMPQAPVDRKADLSAFIKTIDEIESLTNIDFLHKLPDSIENAVESQKGTIWANLPNSN